MTKKNALEELLEAEEIVFAYDDGEEPHNTSELLQILGVDTSAIEDAMSRYEYAHQDLKHSGSPDEHGPQDMINAREIIIDEIHSIEELKGINVTVQQYLD